MRLSSIRNKIQAAAVIALAVVLTGAYIQAQDNDDEQRQQDAVAAFNEGQDLHEKGDLAGAIAKYDKAITLIKIFPEAELQKGSAYLSLNDLSSAEAAFRQAVRDRPDWTLGLAMLGDVLVRQMAIAADRGDKQKAAGLATEASRTLERSIELDVNNYPAYSAMVDLQLRTNAPDAEVTATLLKLQAISDGKMKVPSSVWLARAALEERLGRRPDARSDLKKALDADPRSVNALRLAARLALDDRDVEQAAMYRDELRKLRVSGSVLALLSARIFAAQGKYAEAAKELSSIKEPSAEADELRAKLEAVTAKSTAELEAALQNDPSNAAVLGRLCSAYRVDSPAKAIDLCRRAASAEPDNIDHVIGYARALVQARQFDQAVPLLQKLKARLPDNATVRSDLAAALFQLKRYPEAKAEYLWIVDRMPDRPIAYFLLAITYDHLGEYIDAMANYQSFLKIADPERNQLEIDKVKLRMPSLERDMKGMKRK